MSSPDDCLIRSWGHCCKAGIARRDLHAARNMQGMCGGCLRVWVLQAQLATDNNNPQDAKGGSWFQDNQHSSQTQLHEQTPSEKKKVEEAFHYQRLYVSQNYEGKVSSFCTTLQGENRSTTKGIGLYSCPAPMTVPQKEQQPLEFLLQLGPLLLSWHRWQGPSCCQKACKSKEGLCSSASTR